MSRFAEAEGFDLVRTFIEVETGTTNAAASCGRRSSASLPLLCFKPKARAALL